MLQHLNPTDWTPKEPFYAIRVSGELHPCSYHRDALKGKYEAFIYGTGWKKATKAELVPAFAMGSNIDDFKTYLNKYGKYCLFYAITGKELGSNDCVVNAARHEFQAVLGLGFDYVHKACTAAMDINIKIEAILQAKYNGQISLEGPHFQYIGEDLVNADNLFRVELSYTLMGIITVAPYLDVVTDDSLLYRHFIAVERPDYENEAEMNKLPVCMRDRLVYLFSEEVASDYEALMKLPISVDPKDLKKDLVG